MTVFVLVPLPPSSRRFWFGLTGFGAVLGGIALTRMTRTELLTPARGSGLTVR